MNEKSEHWFGLRPPDGVPVAWGARAIYEIKSTRRKRGERRATIDIPYDRQQMVGSDAERKALGVVVNSHLLPALRAELEERDILGDSNETIEVSHVSDGYVYRAKASPNGSYGYLYLCAWREP